jgi:D-aminopeptidase
MHTNTSTRPRLRNLGIEIGSLPTGNLNAITDVPGVLVGQVTLIEDKPAVARTGVTAIFPRQDVHQDFAYAAYFNFNGIGQMTGLPFIEETGLLTAPVVLTSTNQVGLAHEALSKYGAKKFGSFTYKLPVVAETWDGWLSDSDAYPLKSEHVVAAVESASSGPVAEGNTGGGTGMICYEFKGGTGTSSRKVEVLGAAYHVGVLVQANHGDRKDLLVNGRLVGQEISLEVAPLPWEDEPMSSSIIIIIATDAPLLPHHCKRLAKRATVGLARTGGHGFATSGDIFLAFSTGVHIPRTREMLKLEVLPDFSLDPLVRGTVEAVEEAILNTLVAAETMTGYKGRTAYALPHELLVQALK